VAYYLGIDGGGSKTTCAVGNEFSLLATFHGGPSNITRVGELRAREALQQTIRGACAAAQIAPRQVRRACIGVAGAGREQVAETIRKITAEIIPGEIEVVGDMQIAMQAAFGAGPGVIVIAGTGSIAYGRNERGATARAGGWGFAISDEGSAHWIGRTAVSTLLRAIDQAREGGEESDESAAQARPLFGSLKSVWKLSSFAEFVRTANDNPDFAALFPAIVARAEGGDTFAQSVLRQAGRELAQLAGIIVRQIFPDDSASLTHIALAMVGGVFQHSQQVRDIFGYEVRKLDPRLMPNPQIVEPVAGALQMAREAHSSRLK